MGKQTKQIIFREPDAPFVIRPDVKKLQIREALDALTADISGRMGISLTEAAVVVKHSDARRLFRKSIPGYLLPP